MEQVRLPSIHDLRLLPLDFTTIPPRDERLAKIVVNCRALCEFVEHHATALQEPDELGVMGMVERAAEIVTILENYQHTASCPSPTPAAPISTLARSPNYPREDAVTEQSNIHVDVLQSCQPSEFLLSSNASPVQVTRTHTFDGIFESHLLSTDHSSGKIAAPGAGGVGAQRAVIRGASQDKIKYKKRKQASSYRQCNSCDIVNTPEWRRGPDGQRTLCNACGLHYAKLMRRRDGIISALPDGGQIPPPINIEFLRKSARGAAERSTIARSVCRRRAAEEESKKSSELLRINLAARCASPLGGNRSHTQKGNQQQSRTNDDSMLPRDRSASSGQTHSTYPSDYAMPHTSRRYPVKSTDGGLIQPMVLPPPTPLIRGRVPPSVRSPYLQPYSGSYYSAYNQHPPLSKEPLLPSYVANSQQGTIVLRPPK
ncbi:GATA type zinc finger [Ceratobasidium sp. AG-Ba]|nr:GATA type zinc finger [Ceratobasidium sp. AG-Ba]